MSALAALEKSLSTAGPAGPARGAFARANSNAGHNVFLAIHQERTLAEAEALSGRFPQPDQRPALSGVPVQLKTASTSRVFLRRAAPVSTLRNSALRKPIRQWRRACARLVP